MNIAGKFPQVVRLFIKIYLTVVLFFTLFRFILFIREKSRLHESLSFIDTVHAFIIGLRFDLVVSGYILAIPFVIACVFSFIKGEHKIIRQILFYFIAIVFALAFLV